MTCVFASALTSPLRVSTAFERGHVCGRPEDCRAPPPRDIARDSTKNGVRAVCLDAWRIHSALLESGPNTRKRENDHVIASWAAQCHFIRKYGTTFAQ